MIDKKNVAVILIIILAITFFGFLSYDRSGSSEKEVPSGSQAGTKTEKNSTTPIAEEKKITIDSKDLQSGVKVENGIVYFYDKEKGSINGKIITMRLGDGYLSFAGEAGKIVPQPFGASGFYYDGLEISTYAVCPYEVCHRSEKISYRCDGPLILSNEGWDTKWEYCEKHDPNYISQYEFSAANGNGFTSGGEISYRWYKLYMKRFSNVNLFFFGNLGESLERNETDQTKVSELSSEKYLDLLLQDKKGLGKIATWDTFVRDAIFSLAKPVDKVQ